MRKMVGDVWMQAPEDGSCQAEERKADLFGGWEERVQAMFSKEEREKKILRHFRDIVQDKLTKQ